jgi:hypothetical protein
MKHRLFLLLFPLVFLLGACSWGYTNNSDNSEPNMASPDQNESQELEPPLELEPATTTEVTEADTLFSYEYPDLGIKISYPSTCYFNKGMIDCGDFTLSVWPLEKPTAAEAQKTFKDGYTQIEYGYSNDDNNYALMAWYEGEDKADLEVAIAEIAETLVFTN